MTSIPAVQTMTEAANANIDSLQSLAEIVLNASERLVSLNMDAARSMCAYAAMTATPVMGEGMREQLSDRLGAQGQTLEKAAEYFRGLNDVYMKTQADLAQMNAKYLGQATDSMQSLLDAMAASGPAGTADIIAAMKSAVRNASTAYENMINATREVTETNLAAASNALQPILSASAAANKASRKAA